MATVHLGIEPSLFGEKSVLEDLTALSDEWHIFYSLGFIDRQGFDRQREIDFVTFHPVMGLVFIEVKGGNVRFETGKVTQWLDNQWKDQNPVNQLNKARRVCLEYLSGRGVQGFIPARNIYVFPTTQRPTSGLSQELDECSYFGDEEFELSEYLLQVASSGQAFSGDSEKLIDLLKSCLTYSTAADSISAEEEPVLRSRSLSEILASEGSTFTNIEELKDELRAKREALQALWWRVTEQRSALEVKDKESKFHQEDALVQVMRETNNLLNNSAVEIGVFGQVKRGKSTLVNALIGRKVSATGMMPKTAVPVTIEYSPEESGLIIYSDGQSKFTSIDDAVESTTQSERKRRIEANEPGVDRVIIRLPLDWMQSGVKLVDTPGLSDPANTDVYENFALAELDRVGAAVFVVSYPPGPEQHEVQLISSLASHGLAKIFFVVNTYSDIWKKKGARQEIEEYLGSIIQSVVKSDEIHEGDRRVFVMNLKMATEGQESASEKKIKESGLEELRRNLEDFLSTGALERITIGVGKRLMRAAAVIEGTLKERFESIKNPSRVTQMRDELQQSIVDSENTLDAILKRVTVEVERITINLDSIIETSYASTLSQVNASRDRGQLRTVVSRLSVETSAISSKLINQIQRDMMPVIESARNDLLDSLNVSQWTFNPNDSLGGLMSTKDFSDITIADYIAPKDYSNEARSAGAVIGAILGGGGGVALAATGPVGLAIGGILGWLFADALKEFAQTAGNSREATPHEVQRVLEAVQNAKNESRTALKNTMNKIRTEINRSLSDVRNNVLRDSQAELKHIEFLLSDENGKRNALVKISEFGAELSLITGTKTDV